MKVKSRKSVAFLDMKRQAMDRIPSPTTTEHHEDSDSGNESFLAEEITRTTNSEKPPDSMEDCSKKESKKSKHLPRGTSGTQTDDDTPRVSTVLGLSYSVSSTISKGPVQATTEGKDIVALQERLDSITIFPLPTRANTTRPPLVGTAMASDEISKKEDEAEVVTDNVGLEGSTQQRENEDGTSSYDEPMVLETEMPTSTTMSSSRDEEPEEKKEEKTVDSSSRMMDPEGKTQGIHESATSETTDSAFVSCEAMPSVEEANAQEAERESIAFSKEENGQLEVETNGGAASQSDILEDDSKFSKNDSGGTDVEGPISSSDEKAVASAASEENISNEAGTTVDGVATNSTDIATVSEVTETSSEETVDPVGEHAKEIKKQATNTPREQQNETDIQNPEEATGGSTNEQVNVLLESSDCDAAGRVARSDSHSEPEPFDQDPSDACHTIEEELVEAAADSNDSHSSDSANITKRPMDASGRCSLDLEVQEEKAATSSQEPAGGHGAVDPKNDEGKVLTLTLLEPLGILEETTMPDALPTPVAALEKEASDAAIKAATEVPPEEEIEPQSQLSKELLANKEKEGFGLLARGESFREQELLAQQQQQQQQHHIQDQELYDDYANLQPRIPQEPDAVHKRGDSSVASISRRNSGPGQDLNESIHAAMDDSSIRQIDDNSWRPTPQISYPSSPQGLPAPQAIALNNGGYMVVPQHQGMPHHQGQPPHAFLAPAMLHQSSFHSQQAQMMPQSSYGFQPMPGMHAMPPMPSPSAAAPGGKRKIRLKLQEEILARPSHARKSSFFFGGRSTRKLIRPEPVLENEQVNEVDRGTITVSWFEGTSSIELQEHVDRSVSRKLKLTGDQKLDDIRILDTKVDPPEEIVLCPYIPSGSEFVLRYKLKLASGRASPTASTSFYGPPDSPSAAPSPFPSSGLGGLDSSQLATLRKQLDSVQKTERRKTPKYPGARVRRQVPSQKPIDGAKEGGATPKEASSAPESDTSDADNESDTNTFKPESSVDDKLRQITELLLMDKQKATQQRYPRVEKRHVIFVLANYFVLFFALITVLAEMQARAPGWLSWMENQLENVQTCSADQEALFKCVSNGEFAGLFATLLLWLSRSATTKQIFLLGFDSPQKLWTVFYESLVGAFCWGVSYMFIRRGMNPDTRPQFLQKYWKDAMYGSLAGFNATFMKAVLKNLIPREAVEEAFNDRQLKILSWLPSFA